MKIGVTFDDMTARTYVLNKYDWHTRSIEMDDDLVTLINNIEHLHATAQRVLEALYTTTGKHIMPRDKEILECLKVVNLNADGVEQRKIKATAAASKKESPKT